MSHPPAATQAPPDEAIPALTPAQEAEVASILANPSAISPVAYPMMRLTGNTLSRFVRALTPVHHQAVRLLLLQLVREPAVAAQLATATLQQLVRYHQGCNNLPKLPLTLEQGAEAQRQHTQPHIANIIADMIHRGIRRPAEQINEAYAQDDMVVAHAVCLAIQRCNKIAYRRATDDVFQHWADRLALSRCSLPASDFDVANSSLFYALIVYYQKLVGSNIKEITPAALAELRETARGVLLQRQPYLLISSLSPGPPPPSPSPPPPEDALDAQQHQPQAVPADAQQQAQTQGAAAATGTQEVDVELPDMVSEEQRQSFRNLITLANRSSISPLAYRLLRHRGAALPDAVRDLQREFDRPHLHAVRSLLLQVRRSTDTDPRPPDTASILQLVRYHQRQDWLPVLPLSPDQTAEVQRLLEHNEPLISIIHDMIHNRGLYLTSLQWNAAYDQEDLVICDALCRTIYERQVAMGRRVYDPLFRRYAEQLARSTDPIPEMDPATSSLWYALIRFYRQLINAPITRDSMIADYTPAGLIRLRDQARIVLLQRSPSSYQAPLSPPQTPPAPSPPPIQSPPPRSSRTPSPPSPSPRSPSLAPVEEEEEEKEREVKQQEARANVPDLVAGMESPPDAGQPDEIQNLLADPDIIRVSDPTLRDMTLQNMVDTWNQSCRFKDQLVGTALRRLIHAFRYMHNNLEHIATVVANLFRSSSLDNRKAMLALDDTTVIAVRIYLLQMDRSSRPPLGATVQQLVEYRQAQSPIPDLLVPANITDNARQAMIHPLTVQLLRDMVARTGSVDSDGQWNDTFRENWDLTTATAVRMLLDQRRREESDLLNNPGFRREAAIYASRNAAPAFDPVTSASWYALRRIWIRTVGTRDARNLSMDQLQEAVRQKLSSRKPPVRETSPPPLPPLPPPSPPPLQAPPPPPSAEAAAVPTSKPHKPRVKRVPSRTTAPRERPVGGPHIEPLVREPLNEDEKWNYSASTMNKSATIVREYQGQKVCARTITDITTGGLIPNDTPHTERMDDALMPTAPIIVLSSRIVDDGTYDDPDDDVDNASTASTDTTRTNISTTTCTNSSTSSSSDATWACQGCTTINPADVHMCTVCQVTSKWGQKHPPPDGNRRITRSQIKPQGSSSSTSCHAFTSPPSTPTPTLAPAPVLRTNSTRPSFSTKNMTEHYIHVIKGWGSVDMRKVPTLIHLRAPLSQEPLYQHDVVYLYATGNYVNDVNPHQPHPSSGEVVLPTLGRVRLVRYYPYNFIYTRTNNQSTWHLLTEAHMGAIVRVLGRDWPNSGRPMLFLIDVHNIMSFARVNTDWRKSVMAFWLYHSLTGLDANSRHIPSLQCQLRGCTKFAMHFAADDPSVGVCSEHLKLIAPHSDNNTLLPLQCSLECITRIVLESETSQRESTPLDRRDKIRTSYKHPQQPSTPTIPHSEQYPALASLSTSLLRFPIRQRWMRTLFQYVDGFRGRESEAARTHIFEYAKTWYMQGEGNVLLEYHTPLHTRDEPSVIGSVMRNVANDIRRLQPRTLSLSSSSFWSSSHMLHVIAMVMHSNGASGNQVMVTGKSTNASLFDMREFTSSLITALEALPDDIHCPVLLVVCSCSLQAQSFVSMQEHIRTADHFRRSSLIQHLYIIYMADDAGMVQMCTFTSGLVQLLMTNPAATPHDAMFDICAGHLYSSMSPRMLLPNGQVINPFPENAPGKDVIPSSMLVYKPEQLCMSALTSLPDLVLDLDQDPSTLDMAPELDTRTSPIATPTSTPTTTPTTTPRSIPSPNPVSAPMSIPTSSLTPSSTSSPAVVIYNVLPAGSNFQSGNRPPPPPPPPHPHPHHPPPPPPPPRPPFPLAAAWPWQPAYAPYPTPSLFPWQSPYAPPPVPPPSQPFTWPTGYAPAPAPAIVSPPGSFPFLCPLVRPLSSERGMDPRAHVSGPAPYGSVPSLHIHTSSAERNRMNNRRHAAVHYARLLETVYGHALSSRELDIVERAVDIQTGERDNYRRRAIKLSAAAQSLGKPLTERQMHSICATARSEPTRTTSSSHSCMSHASASSNSIVPAAKSARHCKTADAASQAHRDRDGSEA